MSVVSIADTIKAVETLRAFCEHTAFCDNCPFYNANVYNNTECLLRNCAPKYWAAFLVGTEVLITYGDDTYAGKKGTILKTRFDTENSVYVHLIEFDNEERLWFDNDCCKAVRE